MSLKATVIQSFAKFILGSGAFDRVKDAVLRQETKDLTGKQKQAAVFEEIKILGIGVATWSLNLAIELAVAWLRTKAGEQNGK